MIVCCGEALIDMLPLPGHGSRPAFAAHPGGAAFNTAIALGRLSVPAGLVAGVSRDPLGEMLVAALHESGVRTDLLVRSARPSTLALVQLSGGEAGYSFHDAGSAGRMIRREDLPPLPGQTVAGVYGGISLCMPPAAEALVAHAERHAARHVIVADPNIRPAFVADEPACRARLMRLLRCADVVKLSDADLAWLFPDRSGDDRCRALRALGPALVVLTRGAGGALGWLPGGEPVQVPAVPAEVVDTIGAGDTFNAALLAGLLAENALDRAALQTLGRDTLHRAMTLGARAAAITVSRAGADPPWRAELGLT